MANDKIACSAGRTTLIDPNLFNGQNSSNNMSVPIEDLTIFVELTSERKSRTILTTDKTGDKVVGVDVANESKSMILNLIDGEKFGVTKSLTTSFTDFTTDFSKDSGGEHLGITSIDIDFNSSYAPLITINLIDVRGGAIFQDEEKIKNETNKYATFFTLPYPMYNLTIKGYYGQPVTYCLHMTKFNAKFNSQTGNFEIICSFIGYTYAMLSDMLLGYLKAIPYTTLGESKFAELKKEDPTLLTLNGLLKAIGDINKNIAKISAEDPDSNQLAMATTKQEQLDEIGSKLSYVGNAISQPFKNDLIDPKYRYLVINNDIKSDTIISDYATSVETLIDKYNGDDNKITIDKNDFTQAFGKRYYGVSLEMLNTKIPDETKNPSGYSKKILLENKLKIILANVPASEFDKKRTEIYNFVKQNYDISNELIFDFYDLSKQYDIIKEKTSDINSQKILIQKSLAETLRASMTKSLGFSPTIRSIINIFTASVEVFLYVLYKISQEATTSVDRRNELEPKFKASVDSTDQFGAGENGSKIPLNFYPWPDYRVEDEINGLTEKYLGDPDVLNNPEKVTELNFINELLIAFLRAQKETDAITEDLTKTSTNWFPINPLDTRLFVETKPYARVEAITPDDIFRLMMLRCMIFFGITNSQDSDGKSNLSAPEIQAMAKAEVAALISDSKNKRVIQALISIANNDKFITASGEINGVKEKVILPDLNTDSADGTKEYRYIFNTGDNQGRKLKVLPINDSFTGEIPTSEELLLKYSNEGHLFLTNYTSTEFPVIDFKGYATTKSLDGGVYVSIKSKDEYTSKTKAFPLPSTEFTVTNALDLQKLKTTPNEAGFNVFGGVYGIQEFRNLDFGSPIGVLPFMYMFYENANYDKYSYNKSNGLALKRSVSSETGKKTITFYDNTYEDQKTIGVIEKPTLTDSWDAAIRLIDYDHEEGLDLWGFNDYKTHKQYGKNRELISKMIKGDQDVTYPFINFQIEYNVDDANGGLDLDLAPVSLFGSQFYYEQNNYSANPEYAKALLFLHTFPWTGLVSIKEKDDGTIFSRPEILNTFGKRGGFIGVPKLWAAFIGGLLWRADFNPPIYDEFDNTRIIGGGSGHNDPIIFEDATDSFIPSFSHSSSDQPLLKKYPARFDYLTSIEDGDFPSSPMIFAERVAPYKDYKGIDVILLTLPDQVKNEFKKVFFDFVKSDGSKPSDWYNVKSQFEVFNGTSAEWKSAFNTIVSATYIDSKYDRKVVNKSVMTSVLNVKSNDKYNLDNYIIFTPLLHQTQTLNQEFFKYNYILENKDDASGVKTILELFSTEVIIANMTPNIWKTTTNNFERQNVTIHKDDLKTYFDAVVAELVKNKESVSVTTETKKLEQEVFGTADENLIKFQLYKTCKNIYDKWIGGAEDENIIFQCGSRNSLDQELANKNRPIDGGKSPLRLIDSFRFVSRSFKDIGDDLLINPLPISQYLSDNAGASFYDCVTNLLSANNFDFIPLPAYINYNNETELASIFEPFPKATKAISGPTFVCVYIGDTSKNLDISGGNYPSDGFDVRCVDGSMIGPPKDLISDKPNIYENNVAVFSVNYSQQNQNIFKDITLDQSEFTETAESLQIVDEISKKGAENHRTFGGQNMYNVYSVRSYKAEVEMMGNAMIQPMMYFQLNNIPMFHGAYLITHAKHSIKPNFMSTHFTGVKVRGPLTPLIDTTDLFMSLLGSLDVANNSVGLGTAPRNEPFVIPNTVSVDDLKNKINVSKFDTYKNIKFIKYGNN